MLNARFLAVAVLLLFVPVTVYCVDGNWASQVVPGPIIAGAVVATANWGLGIAGLSFSPMTHEQWAIYRAEESYERDIRKYIRFPDTPLFINYIHICKNWALVAYGELPAQYHKPGEPSVAYTVYQYASGTWQWKYRVGLARDYIVEELLQAAGAPADVVQKLAEKDFEWSNL